MARPERFSVSMAISRAASSSGDNDMRSLSAPESRCQRLRPSPSVLTFGIGELRLQRAQHALGGALGHGEALYHVIECDAPMPRRHQGGECQQLLGLPKRHGMLRCSSVDVDPLRAVQA